MVQNYKKFQKITNFSGEKNIEIYWADIQLHADQQLLKFEDNEILRKIRFGEKEKS